MIQKGCQEAKPYMRMKSNMLMIGERKKSENKNKMMMIMMMMMSSIRDNFRG